MKTIIVDVLGGVATVTNGETGVMVEVHDYDVDGVEESDLSIDPAGAAYVLAQYPPDNPLPETHLELQNEVVRTVLGRAYDFIKGFEGDEAQEGIDELLAAVRSATLIMEGRKNVEG